MLATIVDGLYAFPTAPVCNLIIHGSQPSPAPSDPRPPGRAQRHAAAFAHRREPSRSMPKCGGTNREVPQTMSRYDDLPPATLRQALEAETVPALRSLASLITRRPPTRKLELVALIHDHMEEPGHLRTILASLDDLGRAAVAEAVHGDGHLEGDVFRAKYGGLPSGGGWFSVLFYGRWVPADLREQLRQMVPEPPAARLQGRAELPPDPAPDDPDRGPDTVRLTERPALADLRAVLRLCETGKLRCSETTRRPAAGTVTAIAEVLDEGDFYADEPIAAFAWPLLVQAGGLAELAGGRLQLTARGRRALQAPPHVALRQLWERWLQHGIIDEFSRVDAIKGQHAAGGRNLTAVAPRRHAVAEALSDAPLGRWLAVDEFFAFMRASHRSFDVVRDPWRLYLGDPQYGSFGYAGSGEWNVLQGRFVLTLLFEIAAVLGLIDVAYTDAEGARDDYTDQWGADALGTLSRYDGLRYFRLNALGAFCLGGEEDYCPKPQAAPQSGELWRVLPNLDVVFLGKRLPAADRLLLERYTQSRSEGVWALSPRQILAAIDRGQGTEDLERFLEERVAPPLPDTVVALLGDVRGRVSQLTDQGMVHLVECADPYLAMRLAHDRRLRTRCALVGDRHLAVPFDQEEAFRRALVDAGYALAPEPAGASGTGAVARQKRLGMPETDRK